MLTIVIPTRNRPQNLAGQLRLFRRSSYPIIVADTSDADDATRVRSLCGADQYQGLDPGFTLYDKLQSVLSRIDTPFVLLASDRKVTFPRAIDVLLNYLLANEDHVAAMGYVIGFAASQNMVDINRVVYFSPTIGEADPLQRHYHLMQRYQSWSFALFRTAPVLRAVAQARQVNGAVFQEVLMMNTLALQGKMARLPTILSLQSEERSFHPPKRNDPFYWFLDDIDSFFRHYLAYRTILTDFIRAQQISVPAHADLDQLVDMIHAVWLRRNFDDGVLNHAARLLLGDAIRPISGPELPVPRHKISWRDLVKQGTLRYVWRTEVLRAEPRSEIRISRNEIDRVMEQLDLYFEK